MKAPEKKEEMARKMTPLKVRDDGPKKLEVKDKSKPIHLHKTMHYSGDEARFKGKK